MAMSVAPKRRGPGRPPKAKTPSLPQPVPILSKSMTDEEVELVDIDIDTNATPLRSTTRTRTRIDSSKGKGKGRAVEHSDDDELVSIQSQSRQSKRMRFRGHSPATTPIQASMPKVRLRIPQKGKRKNLKGKRREITGDDQDDGGGEETDGDGDGRTKGMFDDVLGEAERDTSKTVILQSDKGRFERSRVGAEVCSFTLISFSQQVLITTIHSFLGIHCTPSLPGKIFGNPR